ncbi:MAG: hypothetical protein ACFFFG_00685 [Candidatus Thorarchaeota archaeon]
MNGSRETPNVGRTIAVFDDRAMIFRIVLDYNSAMCLEFVLTKKADINIK